MLRNGFLISYIAEATVTSRISVEAVKSTYLSMSKEPNSRSAIYISVKVMERFHSVALSR